MMQNNIIMISIALASYNGSKYIREQLDSILAQTYQDFELIICDDCSSDNTWQICEEYAEKDCRIRIYKNEANIGFKKNFEKAISLCKGDYIALSDQDDIWVDNHLEILLDNIGNCLLICGDSIFINNSGEYLDNNLKLSDTNYDMSSIEDNLTILQRVIFRGNPYQGAAMLLKKSFLDFAMPIPNNCSFHDVWFSLVASALNGFSYTSKIVNKYRMHSSNVTTHEKETLLKKILKCKLSNDRFRDRLPYCQELYIRVGEKADKDYINFVQYSISLLSNSKKTLFRWKTYSKHKKILEKIYKNNPLGHIILKKIQYLFFG